MTTTVTAAAAAVTTVTTPAVTAATGTTTAAPAIVPASTAAPTVAPTVFDFADAESIDGWRTQNDTVMGGVSTGERTWFDGALVFTGDLSLANNGGFASLVSPPVDGSPWATAAGVGLEVVGDGRTYVLQLRLDGAPGGWVQSFATTAGTPTRVTLPWSGFEPVDRFLRPRRADEPLDPAAVRAVAVYLLDKREGPFRLALRTVR